MKKRFMRIMSMLMVFVMTLSMCVTALADEPSDTDPESYVITVENSIGGKTYNAYKIFDATYTADGKVSYTIKSDSPWYDIVKAAEDVFILTEGSTEGEGADAVTTYYVSVKEEVSDDAIIAVFKNVKIEDLEGISASATGTGNGGALDLIVGEAGYYFVTTGSGTVVSIDTAAPTATIVDKNEKPGEGGKDPEDPDWNEGFSKDADDIVYSIGDEVEYKIRSYVPTYDGDKKVVSYTITDTMSKGLTLNAELDGPDQNGVYTVINGVKVEVAGTNIENDGKLGYAEITSGCTVSVSYGSNGETILTVFWTIDELNDDDFTYTADAVVKITYTATVNELADDVNLHNEVGMSWIKIDNEPGNTDNNPEVDVYTFGFELNKTDTESHPLNGAQFELADESGNKISFVYREASAQGDSGTYEVYDGNDEDAEQASTIITVGKADIWGLGEGTYTLTEIVAPEGYNLLKDPVTIVIAALTAADADGNEIVTGWTVTVNGVSSSGTFDDTDEHGIGTMASVTVVNNAGASLPSTGGIGTTIFYVAGTLLVLAAAALVVAKIRLGKTE